MPPSILWYGERGIVNSIVAHLRFSESQLSRVKELLCTIEWADGSTPKWPLAVTEAYLIVEMGLAEFGDPDLIVVCQTAGATPRVIFLEAKATTYEKSMRPNSAMPGFDWGIQADGYNSSINGQLSLKYRFATALAAWQDSENAIIEPQGIFEQYRLNLNDYSGKAPGRRLVRPEVLRLLRDLGLAGLPEENVCYVALTWDRQDRAYFRNPTISSDQLPRFYDHDGQDQFNGMRSRVGWIGYLQVEKALGLNDDPIYMAARSMMLKTVEPTEADYAGQRAVSLADRSADIQSLAATAAALFPAIGLEKLKGSYSLKDESGRTIAKVIPERNRVFIGIRVCDEAAGRSYENPRKWFNLSTLVRKVVIRVPFDGLYLCGENDLALAKEFAECFNVRFQPIVAPVSARDLSDSENEP